MSLDLRERSQLDPSGRVRVPWDSRRITLAAVLAALLLLVPPALLRTDVVPATLIDGLGDMGRLLERMWPPAIYDTPRLLDLLWQTFLIAVAGTFLAVVLSIPLAFLAARNTTPSKFAFTASRAVITVTRAIPDLIFAIIFVRALGLGPLPGALALGIHSIGMLGKLFADAIEESDASPYEAMYSVGARKLQAITKAIVPQVMPSFIGVSLYRLDINVRMSPILGFVGAGGIGMELQSTLRQVRYDRGLTIIIMIFVLIVLVERLSTAIRQSILASEEATKPSGGLRRMAARLRNRGNGNGNGGNDEPAHIVAFAPDAAIPSVTAKKAAPEGVRSDTAPPTATETGSTSAATAAGPSPPPPDQPARAGRITIPWSARRVGQLSAALFIGALVAASLPALGVSPVGVWNRLPVLWTTLAAMWPPDFTTNPSSWINGTIESIMIAVAGTFLGIIITLPFAFLGARNVAASKVAYTSARYGVVAVRGLPELILAVVFVSAVGLGPFAGVMALMLGTVGLSGKLIMDALEQVDSSPVQAMRSVGATRLQILTTAIIPQVVPSMLGTILYQLDINIRASVILGIVGAGGVGFILLNSFRALQYERAFAMLIVIFVVVYGIERLSTWIRGRLI